MSKITSNSGFTLVELVVTLAIVGILSSLAIPSMERIIRSIRVDAEVSSLVNLIQAARGEAVKRGSGVYISAPGNWTGAIVAFSDPNQNDTQDPGEVVVARHTANPKIVVSSVSSADLTDGLGINGTGGVRPHSGASLVNGGRLVISADDGLIWSLICINATGRNHVIKLKTPSSTDPGC